MLNVGGVATYIVERSEDKSASGGQALSMRAASKRVGGCGAFLAGGVHRLGEKTPFCA